MHRFTTLVVPRSILIVARVTHVSPGGGTLITERGACGKVCMCRMAAEPLKGGEVMVTWKELFAFALVVIAAMTLATVLMK